MPITKLVKISPAKVPLTPIAAKRSSRNIKRNITPTNFVTCMPLKKIKKIEITLGEFEHFVEKTTYHFRGSPDQDLPMERIQDTDMNTLLTYDQ